MRARIEAAQKRRSRRRSRCICAWGTLLAGLVTAGVLLRDGSRPIVSISRAVHLQGSHGDSSGKGSGSGSTSAPAGGSNTTTAGIAAAAAVADAVAGAVKDASSADGAGILADLAASAAAADGGKQQEQQQQQQQKKQLYYDKDSRLLGEILDEPIPEDCHPEQHADYAGTGLSWGLDHKTASAAQCCAACKAKAAECNVWVWCGDPSGLCWTPDVWNHTTGACWLKKQEAWDGSTDLAATNLKVNVRGDFTERFRKEHQSAPLTVPWVSGLVKAT